MAERGGLTPELAERVRRMAAADKRTPDQVLCDAVQEYWVRWACRKQLKPEEM